MSNVASLFGGRAPGEPNLGLVEALSTLLERAIAGELQSFIGTGFTADGMRNVIWSDHHANVYEMMGAIVWLQSEYVHRRTKDDPK